METTTAFLYRRYQIDISFPNGIAGGTPATKGLIAQHINRFAAEVTNDLKLSRKNDGVVTEEAIEKYMLACSAIFPIDENGIYIRGHQFNAMLKDAAQRMKATMKTKGLGNTIRDGGVLFPDKVYLNVEPTIVEKPVQPDGKPANIKIFQVAHGVHLSVPCAVLDNGDLPDVLYRQIWIVGQGVALGASRHLGYGRFKIEKFDQGGDWEVTNLWNNGSAPVESSPVPDSVGAKKKAA